MRLAYILARGTRYRSGDELLGAIEPWEWERLKASYRLDPYGDDWDRSSMIAAVVQNAITAIAQGMSGDRAKEVEPLPLDAFVPFRHADAAEEAIDLDWMEELRGL